MQMNVIVGCMFSGKTSELIRLLKREQYAKKRVVAFKPAVDNRYHGTDLASHEGLKFTGVSVAQPMDILDHPEVQSAEVVGIDEVQFFGTDIVDVCQALLHQGKRVIVAGLDLDYQGKPFGPIPTLLAVSDGIYKLTAVCTVCGADATRTQRVVSSTAQVVVGGASAYEARCRSHWSPEPIFTQRERLAIGEMDG